MKGYEGLYKVSNMGRIYSLYTDKVLKNLKSKDGYYRVFLRKNGQKKHASIHRLVAIAFIKNPNNLPQINHKDENPANNNVDNLEWCTAKYNCNYGERTIKSSNSRKKRVGQYSKDNILLKIWRNQGEIKNVLGFDAAAISKCCNNIKNFNTSHGYIWKFEK